MVEYTAQLNTIFASLADPIRRDILERARDVELSVNEIASQYDISLAAVSRHLKLLEAAQLIRKRKAGRYNMVRTQTEQLQEVSRYIMQYEELWKQRFDALDTYIQNEGKNNGQD